MLKYIPKNNAGPYNSITTAALMPDKEYMSYQDMLKRQHESITELEHLLQNKYRLPTRPIVNTAHEAYMTAVNKRLEKAFAADDTLANMLTKQQIKEFIDNESTKETCIDANR